MEAILKISSIPQTNSEEETEDFGLDSLITAVEIGEAVKELSSSSTQGVDEIHPELLKALDVVGLS